MILVTGGTGFIGAALVRALVSRGDRVRSLDNGSRGAVRRLHHGVRLQAVGPREVRVGPHGVRAAPRPVSGQG